MTWRAMSIALGAVAAAAICSAPANGTNLAAAPASMLRWALVEVDGRGGVDTVITLANTGVASVGVRCFYLDATPRCDAGQGRCLPDPDECDGNCIPGVTSTEFSLRLGAQQPTGWRASEGRAEIPSREGQEQSGGVDGAVVPGLGAGPFRGSLLCLAASAEGTPIAADVLIGGAAIETRMNGALDWASYQAFGLTAQGEGPDDDFGIVVGGPTGEVAGCPAVVNLPVLLDSATLEASTGDSHVTTELVVAPCAADLGGGFPPRIVGLAATNEFAQRLTTALAMNGHFARRLALIDTDNPDRSIFSVGVMGTLSARLGARVINASSGQVGFVALAIESHRTDDGSVFRAAFAPSYGEAAVSGDLVAQPLPPCAGDCDASGLVAISELITGVNIALGSAPVSTCSRMDRDGDEQVSIADLIAAVNAALHGCPDYPVIPRPTPSPTPTRISPSADGPEISYFGVASAIGFPQVAASFDSEGRPVYSLPHGQGFYLVVELLPGRSLRPAALSAYSESGELPDVQIIVSRQLGDGSAEVCDIGRPGGGVPATDPLEFGTSQGVVDAINDLGCRVDDGLGMPTFRGSRFCTRGDEPGEADSVTQGQGQFARQFCLPIARGWAFAVGDTIVAARARDVDGNLGPVDEIVVRVRGDR